MIYWNQLNNIDYCYRTLNTQKKYDIFKIKIINKYGSIYKYILLKILINKKKDLHLTINKFPYDIEKNVMHFIIWDLKDNDIMKYKKFAKKYFNSKYYELKFKINKEKYKSIPEINHCHLFVRINDKYHQ